MRAESNNRLAAAITVLGVALNFGLLGTATIFLSVGLVGAYLYWRFGLWKSNRERVLGPYILCVSLFCAHFGEEYFTGFYRDFPALFETAWSPRSFLVFNLVWAAAFGLSVLGVARQVSAAYLLALFLAFAGGVANGAGHLALSLVQGRYFPGTATAPLMLAAGIFLLRRLEVPGVLLTAQAVAFTILVPGAVAWWLPRNLIRGDWTVRHGAGWLPIALGATLYFWCAAQFLVRGKGTPNIYFARHLRFLIGREPVRLVNQSIYRYSRNPMYLGVITVVFGEAFLFGTRNLLIYSFAVWVWFHLVVILVEEPHLRKTRGEAYREYCAETPRWLPKFTWRKPSR
ncbi:MAG TPA: isoprenylcysteine carboxylmethyltransferase family protein [Bryobacteraceae bacterium]|jgi:protein-S-isoprenylcysteine O-methyltransferase Ste14